jgi:hypothetical protein
VARAQRLPVPAGNGPRPWHLTVSAIGKGRPRADPSQDGPTEPSRAATRGLCPLPRPQLARPRRRGAAASAMLIFTSSALGEAEPGCPLDIGAPSAPLSPHFAEGLFRGAAIGHPAGDLVRRVPATTAHRRPRPACGRNWPRLACLPIAYMVLGTRRGSVRGDGTGRRPGLRSTCRRPGALGCVPRPLHGGYKRLNRRGSWPRPAPCKALSNPLCTAWRPCNPWTYGESQRVGQTFTAPWP